MKSGINAAVLMSVVLGSFASCKSVQDKPSEAKDINAKAKIGFYDDRRASQLIWNTLRSMQTQNLGVEQEDDSGNVTLRLEQEVSEDKLFSISCKTKSGGIFCRIDDGSPSGSCGSLCIPPNAAIISAKATNPSDQKFLAFNRILYSQLETVASPVGASITFQIGETAHSDIITCSKKGESESLCGFGTVEFKSKLLNLVQSARSDAAPAAGNLYTVVKAGPVYTYQTQISGEVILKPYETKEVGSEVTVIGTIVDDKFTWAKISIPQAKDGYGLILLSKLERK
jgi:hypothetical protein